MHQLIEGFMPGVPRNSALCVKSSVTTFELLLIWLAEMINNHISQLQLRFIHSHYCIQKKSCSESWRGLYFLHETVRLLGDEKSLCCLLLISNTTWLNESGKVCSLFKHSHQREIKGRELPGNLARMWLPHTLPPTRSEGKKKHVLHLTQKPDFISLCLVSPIKHYVILHLNLLLHTKTNDEPIH